METAIDSRRLRNRPAFTLDRGTAPAMWLVGTLWLIHATGIQTNNRCSFLEQLMPGGLGPPAHRHPLAVEGFYVVEGIMNFHVDGRTIRAEAGTVIHLPRMMPHTFTVESAETRVLNWYAPAGNELHVISLARPADERRRPTMEEGPPPRTDEMNQIISRLYGSVAVTALPFSVPPSDKLLATPPAAWRAGSFHAARVGDRAILKAFGFEWRTLVEGGDTGGEYDLFDVVGPVGAAMPLRILGGDEAIYVLEGAIRLHRDGEVMPAGVGSFSYACRGTAAQWQATQPSRLLVFQFPAGLCRALAGAEGDDASAAAWMEAQGTRFIGVPPAA